MADAILRQCIVYALSSSADGIVRYIGQTQKSLEGRLRDHMNESTSKKKSLKLNWIRQQTKLGNKILITPIKVDAVWNDDEIEIIRTFRENGYALLNMTSGGDGVIGVSEEVRKRISAAGIGRVPTVRHRQVAGDLMRQRWADPEWRAMFAERPKWTIDPESLAKRVKTRRERGGYGHSEDAIKKISDAVKAQYSKQENREKTSIATKAGMARAEIRQKISGENSSSAKLTADQVREMRRLWLQGGVTMDKLAARFGVASSNVSRIVNWQAWKFTV